MAKTEAKKQTDLKSALESLESTLKVYFTDKAPFQLPEKAKETIVKIAPYLSIVGVVFGALGFLALLGSGTFLVPLGTVGGVVTGHPFIGVGYILNALFLGAVVVIEALSIKGLFARKMSAWKLMFYASLVSLVGDLVGLNIVNLIISAVISWYFLFQIRSYYK
jgi:hypothetical protein